MPDDLRDQIESLQRRLVRERKARLEAETIAESTTRNLYASERDVELLQVIAAASNEARTIEEVLRTALDQVCAYAGWPVGDAWIVSGTPPVLVPTRLWHFDDPEQFSVFRAVSEQHRFPPGVGLPGRVLATGRPAWIIDVTRDANFPRARAASNIGVRGGFAFPVMVGTEVAAVLEFFSPESQEPNARLLALMENVGKQLGRVIERQKADEELRAALTQAQESERLKSEFIANMGHEVRTPITVILGYVELITEHFAAMRDRSQDEILAGLHRAGKRLVNNLQNIMDYSAMETGAFRLRPEPLKVWPLIRNEIEQFAPLAAQKGLELRCGTTDDAATVVFDEYSLTLAVRCLLDNAVKFTAEGYVTVELVHDSDRGFRLEIRDTGVGIDDDYLRRIFRPFTQEEASSTRMFEGAGLGLALAEKCLRLNGARLTVLSQKGRGTAVTIFLPSANLSVEAASG